MSYSHLNAVKCCQILIIALRVYPVQFLVFQKILMNFKAVCQNVVSNNPVNIFVNSSVKNTVMTGNSQKLCK